MTEGTYKKKLIEVAIPLELINQACLDESSVPRKGHTSTLHPWWAKRPLAGCVSVAFSSIVDDPSNSLPKKEADKERNRLFKIIEGLVRWENRGNKKILEKAREEIAKYVDKKVIFIDPFSGRGNIPFEAQRLGLKVCASDYNPVAVLIEKGVVEIPPKFLGQEPINPEMKSSKIKGNWIGCKGLASDIRYYGKGIQEQAEKQLSQYFRNPNSSFNPSIYIWMRSVKCPNPACGCELPLTASFWLSKRKSRPCYLKPIVKHNKIERFEIIYGKDNAPSATVSRTGAKCICCEATIPLDYIRTQGKKGKIVYKLIATIEDTKQGRKYRVASEDEQQLAEKIDLDWTPSGKIPDIALGFRIQKYGITDFSQLFSKRQLKVLTTYSELIKEVGNKIKKDGGSTEYVKAVKTYLAFALDKLAAWNSTLCSWIPTIEGVKWTFPRQTLQMSWDFSEINPLENAPGNWSNHVDWVAEFLDRYPADMPPGEAKQLDATKALYEAEEVICSTDPPYYDNIGYANLSDFFYIWLRRTLQSEYPDIFSTLMTPKAGELIADPGMFDGNKEESEKHFEDGMIQFFSLMKKKVDPSYPLTVYYAFKQEEDENNEEDSKRSSTGWEKMLEGLLKSGFMITGTWPMRTERAARQRGNKSNALASSIIIVCRIKSDAAIISTRRDFINALKKELPSALKNLQHAGIAPVDMAQSAIGPGMGIFSRYSKVLEADGELMTIRTALQIINQELDSYLTEQESDMDKETRFCIAWYEQYGWSEAPFGDANTLATAKGTAINALEQAGVLYAKAGKVRLLKRNEFISDWDPTTDKKLTIWECVQYLIKALEDKGEAGAASILKKMGGLSEPVKELSYRLYALCEKNGWMEDGLAYNNLISSWQSVTDKAQFATEISESTKKKLKDKEQKTLNDL